MPDHTLLLSPDWWTEQSETLIHWLMTSGLRVVLILILFLICKRFIGLFIDRSVTLAVGRKNPDPIGGLTAEKRINTLTRLLRGASAIALGIVALMMIFQEFGFAVGPVLASAGIASVAIGFGAQTLVKDVISGAFIIVERQFSVGDIVRIGGASGLGGMVEEINLRTTVLRDADGSAHVIPNGQITQVTVLTRDWSRVILDIGISYQADLELASRILKMEMDQYAGDHAEIVLEAPEVLGVQELGDSAVVVRAWMKVMPGKQFAATRDLRAKIKTAFDAAKIEIPFPQTTVWLQNSGE